MSLPPGGYRAGVALRNQQQQRVKTMAYTVTLRCQCGASYMTTKYSAPTVGQVTTPNGGQKCPGCGKAAPAVVVAVQQG